MKKSNHVSELNDNQANIELLDENNISLLINIVNEQEQLAESSNAKIVSDDHIEMINSAPIQECNKQEFRLESIVDHIQDFETKKILYQVKWRGYTNDENTWEDEKNLKVNCAKKLSKYKKKYNKENGCKFFKV